MPPSFKRTASLSRAVLPSRRVGRGCVGFVLLVCVGCAAPAAPREPTASRSGRPMEFAFQGPHGQPVSALQLRGRRSLVLLLTTFDMASQLMAQRVNESLHTAKPRINALGVVMEAPKYGLFLETYQQTLQLDYPLALADHGTLSGRGAFGAVSYIPTLLVLDARGREVARLAGPVSDERIEDALADALPTD